MDDYLNSISLDLTRKYSTKINIPKSNVLIFTTEDGSKIALRPSGTEPKIKYYISVNEPLYDTADFEIIHKNLETKIDQIVDSMQLI